MSEIDVLMDIDPVELTEGTPKARKALDAIIAYMREQRAMSEQGIRPKKAEGPKKKTTLAALGIGKPKAEEPITPPIKRRGF